MLDNVHIIHVHIICKLSDKYWCTVNICTQKVLEIHKKGSPQKLKLDVDPQRDDDASPMSTYRCMLRPTWMISALQHKSKYKSNSISNFFERKNQIFWFPCCSTREDLSVDVSITYVGLILTKPGRFFFSAYGNSGYGQNSISSILNFLKKIHISGFPWCSTREDHSIDVSITNVELIVTKLRWFQLFVISQNSNFEFFWKKNQIFGFPWCSTREDLSIDVSITNVGLILTKLWWFQLFVKSQNSNFELFGKKSQIFGFPWCSTRDDLSINVSITNVGLILTKLRWFQLFVKSQNSNLELFWKEKSNFGVSMV